ncbi:MAG: DUF2806 domain-containing protein [Deltaproteobacteria bacterium]|nr:DUF2806 domain-containing protein [Deltaproteobacteria bacterium]
MSDFIIFRGSGELTKPATLLIEKVSDAFGGLCKPWQIRRIAKAEGNALKTKAQANAEAALIEARSEIEITELQRRGVVRLFMEEGIKQGNMESILGKAIPLLKNSATPQDMENDWIVNLLDKCRLISDDGMQVLWAKILAGEANSPGSYSKRAVNVLASLDSIDAILFNQLCRFVFRIESYFVPLVLNLNDLIYVDNNINTNMLHDLAEINLIALAGIGGTGFQGVPNIITASYHGSSFGIEFKTKADQASKNYLNTGIVGLTKIGSELFRLCDVKPIDGFYDYAKNMLAKNEGIQIIELRETWACP